MLGAIAGDIIGSTWEFKKEKPDYNFELFPKEVILPTICFNCSRSRCNFE